MSKIREVVGKMADALILKLEGDIPEAADGVWVELTIKGATARLSFEVTDIGDDTPATGVTNHG